MDHTTDEGSEETMKKRMKALEDQITKMAETNDILTSTVKVLREENRAYCDTGDRGSDDESSDDGSHQKDSPMFFSSRKVGLTACPLCSTDLFC
jgi:hypothetical protein